MRPDVLAIVGVALIDVSVGALVAVAAGLVVGVLVAMLLLGLVLCWVGWIMHQWEQLTDEPLLDEDDPASGLPMRRVS